MGAGEHPDQLPLLEVAHADHAHRLGLLLPPRLLLAAGVPAQGVRCEFGTRKDHNQRAVWLSKILKAPV